MDNFQIETAQNIGIHQNVAGIGERIVAFIIDSIILIFYSILSSLAIAGLGLDGGELWVYYLVIGLPLFLYYLLWETFNNGRTPGKAAMQLRVVRMDGARPRFNQYIVRWLLRIIDISLTSGGVAVVTILLNGKGQRLGDLAAGTTVITEKQQVGLSQTLLIDLPDDYEPSYPQVTVLKDKDVQEIKRLYTDAKQFGNQKIIDILSKKVSELLEVEPRERPYDFIQIILEDYNYYTRQ
ncbi:RDD family protein [Antarcticibacterium sp. 1MA-6-2]|uniref:RDD family protein n=1 Tax=Antarcticibacterium sp. 1MA-6-2 TaxID=2908210 RepID=UPI001F24E2F6|nr:RDD family protein [Antarcticibacterium sp. 1MA-6-2]UJH92019.1 RDD family protein [Antarcticibacterium sp. 1MA-6-2]